MLTNVPDDLVSFFASLGVKAEDVGKDIKIKCPFHDDNDPSLSVRKSDGVWNCFGCNESGSFLELLDHYGIDHGEFVSCLDGVSDAEWYASIEKILDKRASKKSYWDEFENFKILSSYYKDVTQINIDRMVKRYAKERGFLTKTIKYFKVGFVYPKTQRNEKYFGRMIIPVHDKDGKKIWGESRRIDGETKRKYLRPYLCGSGDILFNYHRAVKRPKYVILVEGVLDVMKCWEYGYNAVGNFGVRISDLKLNLLSRFDRVYFCYDKDVKRNPRGKTAQQLQDEAIMRASGRGYEVFKIDMPLGKDVCDLSKEEFDELLDCATD